MDEISGVPLSLRATFGKCLTPSSCALCASPSSSPSKMTSTSGRSVHDLVALRWIIAMCGSVKGLGAEKKVIRGIGKFKSGFLALQRPFIHIFKCLVLYTCVNFHQLR